MIDKPLTGFAEVLLEVSLMSVLVVDWRQPRKYLTSQLN